MENSLLKATAKSHLAPSSSSHALFNVNNNKQRATSVRGMFLGWFFFFFFAACLSVAAALLFAAASLLRR